MRATAVSSHDGGRWTTAAPHARRASCRASLRGDDGADASGSATGSLVGADAAGDLWARVRVEPSTHIARRDGDGSRHPIVSNVDCALVVMGLDDDFNLRRLERYLRRARERRRAGGRAEQGGHRGRRSAPTRRPDRAVGRAPAAGRRGPRRRRHRCASATAFAAPHRISAGRSSFSARRRGKSTLTKTRSAARCRTAAGCG